MSNFGLQFEVAGLSASGLTVEDADFSGTGWTMQTSVDPPFHAVEESYTCDPSRQEHVFDTVASWYGPYALEVRAGAAPESVRGVLLAEARAVVAAFQSGQDRLAAAAADLLASTATLARQPVLAEQAHAVAADLRG